MHHSCRRDVGRRQARSHRVGWNAQRSVPIGPKWARCPARFAATSHLIASALSHGALIAPECRPTAGYGPIDSAPRDSAMFGNERTIRRGIGRFCGVGVQRSSYLPMPPPELSFNAPTGKAGGASAAENQLATGGWDPYIVWYERVRKPWREALAARAASEQSSSEVATAIPARSTPASTSSVGDAIRPTAGGRFVAA